MSVTTITGLLLAAAWGWLGYRHGRRSGIRAERLRVLYGMDVALNLLSSPALHYLNGWIRGDIDEDYLRAGVRDYAKRKQEKHEAERKQWRGPL